MAELETIKVENAKAKRGFMTINKSDFDPKVHIEFCAKPKAAPKAEPIKVSKPTAPSKKLFLGSKGKGK